MSIARIRFTQKTKAQTPVTAGVADYVNGIDGLRAYAVLGVVFFHIGYMPFGWAGVWLFFVISGFVITLSLVQLHLAAPSLKSALWIFYYKRALRIFPLYFLFIALGIIVILASRKYAYFHHLPYLFTFTYNFYRIWPLYQHTQLFGHYWSLSVEEQFYFLYPLLLLTCERKVVTWVLMAVLAGAPVIRAIVGIVAFGYFQSDHLAGNAVYQFSFGNFDSFAAGALLALHRDRVTASHAIFRGAIIGTVVAATLYAIGCFWTAESTKSNWQIIAQSIDDNVYGPFQHIVFYSILILLSATAIVAVLRQSRVAMALTGHPFIQYIGRISFGLYIVHFPLLGFYGSYVKPHLHGPVANFAGLCLYFVILFVTCHLLYNHYERYFTSLKPKLPQPPSHAPAISAVL